MFEKLREYVRPVSVAALIASLLLGAAISGGLEAFRPGFGVAFTNGVAGWFKAIPEAFYDLTMVALLGYAGARTVEKATATYATAKYNPPARSEVDNPDA